MFMDDHIKRVIYTINFTIFSIVGMSFLLAKFKDYLYIHVGKSGFTFISVTTYFILTAPITIVLIKNIIAMRRASKERKKAEEKLAAEKAQLQSDPNTIQSVTDMKVLFAQWDSLFVQKFRNYQSDALTSTEIESAYWNVAKLIQLIFKQVTDSASNTELVMLVLRKTISGFKQFDMRLDRFYAQQSKENADKMHETLSELEKLLQTLLDVLDADKEKSIGENLNIQEMIVAMQELK